MVGKKLRFDYYLRQCNYCDKLYKSSSRYSRTCEECKEINSLKRYKKVKEKLRAYWKQKEVIKPRVKL